VHPFEEIHKLINCMWVKMINKMALRKNKILKNETKTKGKFKV
jgi:hypothetical protein